SLDGRWLGTASADKTGRIWSAETGKLQTTLTHKGKYVLWLAFSPDATQVATCVGSVVCLWKRDGTFVREFDTGRGEVVYCQFTADGQEVLFVGGSSGLVDIGTGKIRTLTREVMTGGTISRDGKRAVTVSATGDIKIWKLADASLVQRLTSKSKPVF